MRISLGLSSLSRTVDAPVCAPAAAGTPAVGLPPRVRTRDAAGADLGPAAAAAAASAAALLRRRVVTPEDDAGDLFPLLRGAGGISVFRELIKNLNAHSAPFLRAVFALAVPPVASCCWLLWSPPGCSPPTSRPQAVSLTGRRRENGQTTDRVSCRCLLLAPL